MLTLNFSDGAHIPEEIPQTGDTSVLATRPDCDLISRVVCPGVELPAAVPSHQGGDCSLVKLLGSEVRLGVGQLQLVSSVVSLAVQDQLSITVTISNRCRGCG